MDSDTVEDPAAPTPASTRRFTMGLLLEVAEIVESHGYGPFDGRDFVELKQHLLQLLHGDGGRCIGHSRPQLAKGVDDACG